MFLEMLKEDFRRFARQSIKVIAVLISMTVILSATRVFILKQDHLEHEVKVGDIDRVDGHIAEKISYLYELRKLCDEYAQVPHDKLKSTHFFSRFSHFYYKKIQARVELERSGEGVSRIAGDKAFDVVKYFIQLDEDSLGVPRLYCKKAKRMPDWEILKKKQKLFRALSFRKIDRQYAQKVKIDR